MELAAMITNYAASEHCGRTAETRQAYLRELDLWLDYLGGHAPGYTVLTAGSREVEGFLDHYQAMGNGPSALRRKFYALAAFYRWALATGLVPALPTTGVTVPASAPAVRPTPAVQPQDTHGRGNPPGLRAATRYRDLALVACAGAHRIPVTQLVALDWTDIDLVAGVVLVPRLTAPTRVELDSIAVLALRALRCHGPTATQAVFVSQQNPRPGTDSGQRLSVWYARRIIRESLQQVSVAKPWDQLRAVLSEQLGQAGES